LVDIPHPAVIDILAFAGFDCVEMDREITASDLQTMEWALLACHARGLTPFWRMAKFDEGELKRALDLGYECFIVPHVRNAAEAEQAIKTSRYAPRGNRGVGPGRQIRYGLGDPVEYFRRADNDILIGLMIEDPEAVENIEEIVAVDGVELVQLGFWDLSAGYGLPFQERHPRLVEAAERVLTAAKSHNVAVGIPPVSPEDMAHWRRKGAQYFELSTATMLLSRAASDAVAPYARLSKSAGFNKVDPI